jgi:alkylated DNA repair dioxygenase AlkB
MRAVDPTSLVDLERYPIVDLGGAGGVVADGHAAELQATGVSILPGFLRSAALPELVAECDALASGAFLQDVQGTPYLELPDAAAWSADHPRVTWSRSAVHTVAYDRFDPTTSGLRALFEWDDLLAFVARILGRSPLHRYADPLGAMNLAVMRDGDTLGWHFDQTDFVVSLAIQASEAGGEFENVARLRWVDGGDIEERYDTVGRVLAGDAPELVTTVPMTPGTLMVFEGRWSLHRVTPVRGATARHVALFGYDTTPGTMSSDLLKAIRYGRTAPEPLPA